MTKVERKSSFEALKLIAMFLIVISHSIPFYGDPSLPSHFNLSLATNDVYRFFTCVFKYFGSLGNCIFISCSAWFLLDNDKVNGEKILSIIMDCFFISIAFLAGYLITGNQLSLKTIYMQLLPVTCGNNWFIGCYILVYIFHPYINHIINNITRREHLSLVVFLFLIYCFVSIFIPYSEMYSSKLVIFITIYIFTAYMKKYMPEFQKNTRYNRLLFYGGFLALILLLFFTNLIGLKINRFSDWMSFWDRNSNPILILIALTLINIFRSKNFSAPFVNYLSSVTLIIYLLHENILFKEITKSRIWLYIYNYIGYEKLALLVLVFAIIQFILASAVACVYKVTLQPIVSKAATKCWIKLKKLCDKLLDYLILIK